MPEGQGGTYNHVGEGARITGRVIQARDITGPITFGPDGLTIGGAPDGEDRDPDETDVHNHIAAGAQIGGPLIQTRTLTAAPGEPVRQRPRKAATRFGRSAVLGVFAVVMAVFTPYVFRTESTWMTVAWSVVLIGTVTFIAALIRTELWTRSPDRRTRSDDSKT
ncbi:hypothetical protein KQY30_00210 [Streptomyces sp. GMY02]|uniref:hypothetical protein n=1 Tax=Streptomyces sp. GMY02 TaxID=1333528 RepID=UPI001C2C4AD2|nr:hypothetical protein [Streptomyces sp. GMY02]QXE39628.1 hypothetical protein KQY30_00210 [Streptomyces sp. GMY02]